MVRSGRDRQDRQDRQDKQQSRPVVANKSLAQRMVTYTQSSIPIRTIILMEVGDLPAEQVRAAVDQVRKLHGESLHPTFVMPVRNGRVTGDVMFESEILDMVNKLCEVIDGAIALRGGARDVDVLRTVL